jgi:hypothetical protein
LPKLEAADINPGDELYIDSSWSIDHGETDTCGGIVTVKGFSKWGNDQPRYFVSFKEVHRSVNLEYVLEHQDQWEAEYGNRIAHDCPDVSGHMCTHPERKCSRCDGVGKLFSGVKVGKTFVCEECGGSGKGKIKRSPMDEALRKIRSSALRFKLMRAARREI